MMKTNGVVMGMGMEMEMMVVLPQFVTFVLVDSNLHAYLNPHLESDDDSLKAW